LKIRLIDALRKRFATPDEALEALGLDTATIAMDAELNEMTTEKPVVIAHDEQPIWRDHRWDSPNVTGDNQGEE